MHAIATFGLGIASVRYIESLFYQVKATDLSMLAFRSLTLFAVAVFAALPAVFRRAHRPSQHAPRRIDARSCRA